MLEVRSRLACFLWLRELQGGYFSKTCQSRIVNLCSCVSASRVSTGLVRVRACLRFSLLGNVPFDCFFFVIIGGVFLSKTRNVRESNVGLGQ